ncbi:retropepsin-like aspartic protease [Methyloglobulus sp.]|uniref:retropepsin-like aspartic protease family protein n=1 Tax=Methyloglobulus sp. TaxID=2518622 RepID=UPI0032B846B8
MQINVAQLLFIVILAASSVSAWSEGMIYKCKNQQAKLIYQKSPCKATADMVSSWTPKEAAKPLLSESDTEQDKDAKKQPLQVLTLKQNASGHYVTDASVDGKPLNFVVDTGASYVSLPESIAHDAQIYCGDKIGMDTANGVADACAAKIKKLQIGPFLVQDVSAVIVPNLSQPLLGMNVLQLFKIGQENGEMQISVLEKAKP